MPDAEVDKEPEGNDSDKNKGKDKNGADNADNGPEPRPEAEEASPPQTSKSRSVSFNRDVHVKRIAPNRTPPGPPGGDSVRRQTLSGLSKEALAQEAAKVLAQASSVRCSSSSSPDKFFSLPTRRRQKLEQQLLSPPLRRRSEELGITADLPVKSLRSSLNRSVSDVTAKKQKRNNNTLLNLFKRPEKDSNQDQQPKRDPVKRSKSDVSDLKSASIRPIRKRTGSESEEYLNSVVGKKSQLSPIIEISQADDYFKSKNAKDSVDEGVEKIVLETSPEYKVNPIEKPPRVKDPKPPTRIKRVKEDRPRISNTLPKSKSGIQKRLLVDEVDSVKNSKEIKKSIKDVINLIESGPDENKSTEMIHSSQKPPDKLPLTKGQTVDTMVKILNQDKYSPPPKSNILISPNTAAHNNNQPFSYTKPTSVSPDPNLYARSLSPDRAPSPINKMNEDPGRGIIYAQVVCGDNGTRGGPKQTVHTTVNGDRHKFMHNSDEDEGLGYEDSRNKYQTDYSYKNFDYDDHSGIKDSPITPRIKEFRSHKFVGDEFEDYDLKDLRGRGDGMDSRRRDSVAENDDHKFDKKADLSYRRELLENRFNARLNRDQTSPGNTRYTPEKDYAGNSSPIETRQYTSESSSRYYKDGKTLASGFNEKYSSEMKKDKEGTLTRSENRSRSKFNPNTSTFEPVSDKELDRREFIDRRLAEEPPETKYFSQKPARYFPPEPDYEPPSLDSQTSGPRYSPDVRKYKQKGSRPYTSSQDGLHTTSRYNAKHKHEKFGNNRDHYASNPEIIQKSRDEYDPSRPETYHNSLRRQRHNNSDRHYRINDEYLEQSSSRSLRQQGSNGKKDYLEEMSGPESSRSRYENDRDRDNKFADSGIENDYRKDSNGDIHSRGAMLTSPRGFHLKTTRGEQRNESEDEGFASSLLIASERQHTEDNCSPTKGRYNLDSMDYRKSAVKREEFVHRERNIDDGSFYDPRLDKFEDRSTLHRTDTKPPKPVKKISGLEKVKQLFSRDSSKKSKKDKDKYKATNDESRSRLKLRNENIMVKEEDLRRRYTEYKGSSEDLDIIEPHRGRMSRASDLESGVSIVRNSRGSRIRDDEDSSALGFDYSQRRRMATPSPSPSPPRRQVEKVAQRKDTPRKPPVSSNNGWFKSLDRLSKNKKTSKLEKDSVLTTTEDESNFISKRYTTNGNKAPTKSLRFFGDTDQESNSSSKNQSTLRKRSGNSKIGKSLSSSVHALDRTERYEGHRSSSLTNLDSRQSLLANSYNKEKYNGNRRDLHNISEIHSNSETESQFEEREKYGRDYKSENSNLKSDRKPPMSPMRDKRRSRSHSAPKISKSTNKNGYLGSRGDLTDGGRTYLSESHASKSDLRSSKQELTGSKGELRTRRRRMHANDAISPADSSTEGDSSHQSQRSIVYLHAATVGDIPTTGRISRGKSRDDVSSVNSSLHPQVKTVSRSFSVLAPWKPRHYREGYDINYSQSGHQSTMKRPDKSSRTSTPVKNESTFAFGKSKSSSTKNLASSKHDLRPSEERSLQNKSNSSTLTRQLNKDDRKKSTTSSTLYRKTDKTRLGNSSSKENLSNHYNTMTKSRNDLRDRNYKKSMSTEVLSRESPPKGTKRTSLEREKLSRSISMPKDPNKSAGWFRITKKSKKVENTSRVY